MAKWEITGSDEADVLVGKGKDELIEALAGEDLVVAGAGDDTVFGGDDNDVLAGEDGDDVLVGDRGNDIMLGGNGSDRMIWNNGDGTDIMEGGAGYDTAEVNGSDDLGDEFLLASNGDRLDFQRVNFGQFSLDIGSTEKMIVNGLGGNDIIKATGLDAGLVKLRAYGDEGDDEIFGSQGDDYLKGGSGDDLIVGNRGDDKMYGGSGDDTMVWNNGDGSDRMDGDSGHDTVQVNGADGAGDEFEIRSNGDHVEFERVNLGPFTLDIRDTEQLEVRGQGGDDSIDASDLDAGQIKLRLYGGDGDDTITGSEGRDYINGGNGDDLMTGGDGADTFLFRRGGDTITDFENGVDRIKISAGNEYDSWDEVVAVATQEGNDVEIDFGGNDVLTLENFDINNLDASDFLF